MTRRIIQASALAAAAAVALVLGWTQWELRRPYAGWAGDRVDVVLEPGLDAGSMISRLHEAGVLRSPRLLRAWLAWSGESGSLQAGEYRFEASATPLEVARRLIRGEVLLHAITIPEGLVLEEIAERVAAAGFSEAERLAEAFRDPSLVRELDERAGDLEGYLFPDTYHFPSEVDERAVAAAMVERFREVAGGDYAARAERVGLDLRQAVTLASMIEKETSLPGERRRISAVFHNRLREGMLLQCDPTVVYAHRREGRLVQRLLLGHLELDSPWNTYRVRGLPPGPIANPGGASLEAAVDPEQTDEFYFVAAPEGGHRFSADLAAHQQAVAAWRRYSRSSR